jgi:hypothetical protein
MSSEISSPHSSEPVKCPWCGSNDLVLTHDIEPDMVTRAINKCKGCGAFVAVMQKTTVTVHKIDGMGPIDADIVAEDTQKFIESLSLHTCFRCEKGFHAALPCKLNGEVYCSDCFDKATHDEEERHGGTHPDTDQFLCSHCGTLHNVVNAHLSADGGKICKDCFEEELAEHEQNRKSCEQTAENCEQTPASCEQNEPEYIQLPDSRTVSYCIDGDIIKLQYKGNDCNSYTFDVVWDIVDSPKPDWMSRIDEMLEGEKNHIQKASALNQLCKAVSKGTVKIPGSDEQ